METKIKKNEGKTMRIKILVISILSLMLTISVAAQWTPQSALTGSPGYSLTGISNQHSVVSSGNTVHVVFYDQRDATEPGNINSGFEVYYKRSDDGGALFGPDQRLTFGTDIDRSINPCVAVNGTTIHVIYDGKRNNGTTREMYYIRSNDNGNTWTSEVQLTSTIGAQSNSVLEVSGNNVYAAYYDNSAGNSEIYFLRSANGGLTWSSASRMSTTAGKTVIPCLEVSGSNVYLVYADSTAGKWALYFRKSTNNGQSFGSAVKITAKNNNASAIHNVSLSSSGNNVCVVWSQTDNVTRLRSVNSNNAGGKWSGEFQFVSSTGTQYSYSPSLTSSASGYHLTYSYVCASLIYLKSTAIGSNGITWGASVNLTPSGYYPCRPHISADGSTIHIVNYNNTGDANQTDIWYRRNTNSGNGMFTANTPDNLVTPGNFALMQNYPNPFNPSTTISFNIPVSGMTTLKVFDVTGKEVAELVSGSLDAGNHGVSFNATNLTSGVYYYRLESSGNVDVKKMLLVK